MPRSYSWKNIFAADNRHYSYQLCLGKVDDFVHLARHQIGSAVKDCYNRCMTYLAHTATRRRCVALALGLNYCCQIMLKM